MTEATSIQSRFGLPLPAKDATAVLRPKAKVAYIRRLAWLGALLAVATVGIVEGDLRRRAEPYIGRYVADLFVFSVLRNESGYHGPSLAAADTDRVPPDAAERP
jgi:hypothetical protein